MNSTVHNPLRITFTGVDESADREAMWDLWSQYPIEWAFLFSPSQQGQGRYPSISFITDTIQRYQMDYAAHLCGGHSADVIAGRPFAHGAILAPWFKRVQINTSEKGFKVWQIANWANQRGLQLILQCSGAFPGDLSASWLFDQSAGRGNGQGAWPKPLPDVFCGYAGDLSPENVARTVSEIGAGTTNYWLEFEAGVRNGEDRFSVDRCRSVCEALYGREFVKPYGRRAALLQEAA